MAKSGQGWLSIRVEAKALWEWCECVRWVLEDRQRKGREPIIMAHVKKWDKVQGRGHGKKWDKVQSYG